MSATAERKPAGAIGPSSRLVLLLSKFRATHAAHTLDVAGDRWEYVAAGGSEPALVILPGAGGTSEVMFEIISTLEPRFRVVSIGYPASVSAAENLIDGVREVLEANNIQQALLVGHSLGGILAQAFASRHPERVKGMVLANTGFYHGIRSRVLPAIVQVMVHAPESMLIRFTRAQMIRLTKNSEAHEFWLEYFDEKLSEPDQAMRLKHQAACIADLVRFWRIHPVRPELDWVQSMPVLLIHSENDRGNLQALYPKSTVYDFARGAGHASFVVRPREFCDAIASFVDKLAVAYNGNA